MEGILTYWATAASLGPVCLAAMCLEAVTADDTLTTPNPTEHGLIVFLVTGPLVPNQGGSSRKCGITLLTWKPPRILGHDLGLGPHDGWGGGVSWMRPRGACRGSGLGGRVVKAASGVS